MDPSPPYVALQSLYEKHFADPASALSPLSSANDEFNGEGDDDSSGDDDDEDLSLIHI